MDQEVNVVNWTGLQNYQRPQTTGFKPVITYIIQTAKLKYDPLARAQEAANHRGHAVFKQ